jgi:T5SS/PEP-CTERM-associated repeat protein
LSTNGHILSTTGATLTASWAIVGHEIGEDHSQAWLTGVLTLDEARVIAAPAVWNVADTIMVGELASGCAVSVGANASLKSLTGIVGSAATATNNGVFITGIPMSVKLSTGWFTPAPFPSTWVNGSSIVVGDFGSGNSLGCSHYAAVLCSSLTLGRRAGANNNHGGVSGTSSSWSITGPLVVGGMGAGNQLAVLAGGSIHSGNAVIGSQTGASNNWCLLRNAGSLWRCDGPLVVGDNGSQNSLSVGDGGVVISTKGIIGRGPRGDRNGVGLANPGTLWANADAVIVGDAGSGNSLEVFSGAAVLSASGVIGQAPDTSGNQVKISGLDSRWVVGGNLAVGGEQVLRQPSHD